MKNNSYHFSLGNSTNGPIGLCARVKEESKARAVCALQQLFEDRENEIELLGGEDYVTIYLNPRAVTEEDIDFWNTPDGEEYQRTIVSAPSTVTADDHLNALVELCETFVAGIDKNDGDYEADDLAMIEDYIANHLGED